MYQVSKVRIIISSKAYKLAHVTGVIIRYFGVKQLLLLMTVVVVFWKKKERKCALYIKLFLTINV